MLAAPALAKPWKGAELISQQTFEYGAFEARIRAARGSGLITPFFLWKNNSEIAGVPWQEQDFEIFGRDGNYQTQLMTPGTDGEVRTEHVQYHSLEAPAWEQYHTYRMEWTPDYLAFYVDGQLVREETDPEEYGVFLDPSRAEPAQLRLSLWAGDSGWSGSFDESAVPAAVFVNWVRAYSYTPGASGGDFSPLWRDDFDSLDSSRWWTANWTFDYAVNDYTSQNVSTADGKLIIVFTDEDSTGQFPTPPEDSSISPPPPTDPPEGTSCSPAAEYAAGQMLASTGAATSDGWNLWANGTLSTEHTFSGGDAILSVSARGQLAAEEWPEMTLLVGDREVGSVAVDASDYATFEFFTAAPAGSRRVSVRFDNDYYQGGQDRNLIVESLRVEECLE